MQADRIQKNGVPVQPGGKHSRQSFQLADNRSSAIAQAKLIQNVIQRAAHIDSSSSRLRPKRELKAGWTDWSKNLLYIDADPGFGQNIGWIPGLSITHNSAGSGHTEPNLISKFYGKSGGDWSVAKDVVDDKNAHPPRVHFELFTERYPCKDICEPNLKHERFTPYDYIYWTYPQNITNTALAGDYLQDVPMMDLRAANPKKDLKSPYIGKNDYGTVKIVIPFTPK